MSATLDRGDPSQNRDLFQDLKLTSFAQAEMQAVDDHFETEHTQPVTIAGKEYSLTALKGSENKDDYFNMQFQFDLKFEGQPVLNAEIEIKTPYINVEVYRSDREENLIPPGAEFSFYEKMLKFVEIVPRAAEMYHVVDDNPKPDEDGYAAWKSNKKPVFLRNGYECPDEDNNIWEKTYSTNK